MKNIGIVTGASSGIGKEFFLTLIEKEPNLDEVWVIARSQDKLQQLQLFVMLTNSKLNIFCINAQKVL